MVHFRVADPREHVSLDHRTAPHGGRIHAASQTWTGLLFAHYRADLEPLALLLPPRATLDLYDGDAWLTVSPFRVVLRPLPDLPVPTPTVSFLEVNVRTYVRVDGQPGIFFFSLDATSRTAVWTAQRLYRLPYRLASGSLGRDRSRLTFVADRCDSPARFQATYRPVGAPRRPDVGSLEHFLVERYRLYAEHDGTLLSADIHHRPWLISPSEATIQTEGLLEGLAPVSADPLTHYCSRQDVLTWLPHRC